MPDSNQCPRCGAPQPSDGAFGGGCPRCMLELGFETSVGSRERLEHNAAAERPAVIGRYRILRLIGEGGMGAVYEAEQDHPRRTVALKIIKTGMATPELLRRFEQESQALGRLQHPGIAQIHEAGTVDTGFGPQPYFAMEFIRGRSPRDYAEANHLGAADRLRLMIKICDAVHHAHQRGLIHRDLKPGNILVDDAGQPKILDFGVARVTDSDARATLQTDMGQLVGTLAYMSPEQALADPLDIDTRSDVYSLGVILYELLSGRLPYNVSKKVHEAIQAIREEDPARLSTSNRTFRGDIETIVAKALEKERERRYASAAEMAADIQRYLSDEPIVARRPSTSYQLQKFARRNRVLVAGVATVFVVLIVGIVVAVSLLVRTRQAEQMALVQQNVALDEVTKERTLLAFLRNDLFGPVMPAPQALSFEPIYGQAAPKANPNIKLKDALDLAVPKIHRTFETEPDQEATVREIVAATYRGLGRFDDSRDQFELAANARLRAKDANIDSIRATMKLAATCSNLRLYGKAQDLAKKVVIDSRHHPVLGDAFLNSALDVLTQSNSLNTSSDRLHGFLETERFLKVEVIDYQRRTSGEKSPNVLDAELALLAFYTDFSPPKFAEAELFAKQIADERRRAFGEDSPEAINAERDLILLYLFLDPQPKYAEAKSYLKTLIAAQRRSLGVDNPATQAMLDYLVGIYLDEPQNKGGEAEALLRAVAVEADKSQGRESFAFRNASVALARLYLKQARYSEVAKLLAPLASESMLTSAMRNPRSIVEQLAIPDRGYLVSEDTYYPRKLGRPSWLDLGIYRLRVPEQPTILEILDLLAASYAKQGNTPQAQLFENKVRMLLETAVSFTHKDGAQYSVRLLSSMAAMAIRNIEEERYVEAEDLLNTVINDYNWAVRKSSDAGNIRFLLTSAALVYTKKGKDRQGETLLKKVLEIDYGSFPGRFFAQGSLGRLATWYMDRGRYEEARNTYNRLCDIQAAAYGRQHPVTQITKEYLAAAYDDRSQMELAEGRRDRAQLLSSWSLEIRNQLVVLNRRQPDGE